MAVGIVVVSHSQPLARAAVDLALEMVAGTAPTIVVAAGTAEGGTGTDAARVAEAILEADSGEGVVVITDLGSAVLSAELALELLPEAPRSVRITPAPFVEGILAAVVRAAGGAAVDEVAAEAASALKAKLLHLGAQQDQRPGKREEATPEVGEPAIEVEVVLINPAGLHARPAAQFADAAARFSATITVATPHHEPVAAVSPVGLATLNARQGDQIRISATGAAAREAVDALVALVSAGFGEVSETEAAPTEYRQASGGLGVSPGRVVGTAVRMPEPIREPDRSVRVAEANRSAEVDRLQAAATRVAERLRAHPPAGETSDILRATAAIALDPAILDDAGKAILEDGATAQAAIWSTLTKGGEALRQAGGRQGERAADLFDVRGRIVAELLGTEPPGIPDPGHLFVLIAEDLAPADTATLDAELCLAIVTEQGGPTSHTAIIARALGIPAIVGSSVASSIPSGATVLVDGTTGELVIDPTEEQRRTARRKRPVSSALTSPGRTADGHAVSLLANIAGSTDVARALEARAEGVGLFRTEFCFLDRKEAPGIDEQVTAYRDVLAGFPGRHVVVRTLDAGSDKPMPFLNQQEPNPALGVRGYRTAVSHPWILEDQLAAIAQASRASEAEVWVMAPMISTVEEAAQFVALAHGAGLTMAGVMIETPAAALQATEILHHVDFVSIGTNDLTQYTLAADRLSGPLAALNDPWQPAVLRLIAMVGAAGLAGRKPVGVCGEAAADPLLASVLVGYGVGSLSMSAPALSAVGSALLRADLATCRRAAEAAARATSAQDARQAALETLSS